ncbi:MAG: AAA family ATPase [Christensenellales bacterium]|jgi:CYTH domain-containing protein/transcriptional regulator with XRE-family HTH domain
MNDYHFGNRLLSLREKLGLSQGQLGKLIGVSNKSISKWETGAAKPGVDTLSKLALALQVSVNELVKPAAVDKQITRIVITGGPCAGKTTALSWIQNAFSEKGYQVVFVPETATELISGGAAPWLCPEGKHFQTGLIRLQLAKEEAFAYIAGKMAASKILLVMDRGALDNKAYMSPLDFQYVMQTLGTNEVELRDHYDAVFHLVTAAKGAEEFYTLANNRARTETPEQAAALDDQLIAAWTGHPHLRIIDNSTDFNKKMLRLIAEVSAFLGEPEPLEVERKFLIQMPNLHKLERLPACTRVNIVQTYLKSPAGEEVRIRQRGTDRHFIYFKTIKRAVSPGKRVEVETRLNQVEYLQHLIYADPQYRQIQKTRYCLSRNGTYYEIDIYPQLSDRAILEVELRDEHQPVSIPKLFKVIREVTGEEAYLNRNIAKDGFPEEKN